MKLISFGDSFVEGLIKDPYENSVEERDKICFTRKLVKRSKYLDSYKNFGLRGIGNLAISYKVYKYVENYDYKNSFLLVCWSGLDRESVYCEKRDEYEIFQGERTQQPIFQTNILASGIHNYLKSKQIPHLFTSSFTPFYLFHNKDTIPQKYIIGNINKANSLFDIIGKRFNKKIAPNGNYTTSHADFNVPKTDLIAGCLHPTGKGHSLIASTLALYIDNFISKEVLDK